MHHDSLPLYTNHTCKNKSAYVDVGCVSTSHEKRIKYALWTVQCVWTVQHSYYEHVPWGTHAYNWLHGIPIHHYLASLSEGKSCANKSLTSDVQDMWVCFHCKLGVSRLWIPHAQKFSSQKWGVCAKNKNKKKKTGPEPGCCKADCFQCRVGMGQTWKQVQMIETLWMHKDTDPVCIVHEYYQRTQGSAEVISQFAVVGCGRKWGQAPWAHPPACNNFRRWVWSQVSVNTGTCLAAQQYRQWGGVFLSLFGASLHPS